MDEEKNNLSDQKQNEWKEQLKKLQESSKESLSLNKELHKLLLGLATGTLVFSVTFIDKLAPQMLYKNILAMGWFSLLVSVLASVAFISLAFSQFILLRNIPSYEYLFEIRKKIKHRVKERAQKELSWDEATAEKFGGMFLKKNFWDFVHKKGFFSGEKTSVELIEKEKGLAKVMAKFISGLEKVIGKDEIEGLDFQVKQANKLIREIMVWAKVITILGYVSQGAFFVGVLFIAVFGFLNF